MASIVGSLASSQLVAVGPSHVQLSTAIVAADTRLQAEQDKTIAMMTTLMAEAQDALSSAHEENSELQTALIAQEGRFKALEISSGSAIEALEKTVQEQAAEIAALRARVTELTQQNDQYKDDLQPPYTRILPLVLAFDREEHVRAMLRRMR